MPQELFWILTIRLTDHLPDRMEPFYQLLVEEFDKCDSECQGALRSKLAKLKTVCVELEKRL